MLKCKTCGKELSEEDEGRTWRRCTICKKPVCFDDIHYIGTWMRGLYKDYVTVIPVCEDELPRKRLKAEVEEKL
ncbi:hypothetical protein GAH_01071 [Geoglobus ahangari]|uniref:Uncharacterized protein n=1 Tax=Geoglobus ahangari TaxID=113653 RepID=A0A0F7IFH7_9EURY|nr:hypothetical protein [Geoglobus ahangari]AKG91610.1 hypothetical protein GAH_01071 [Geoglobus ahangari]